MTGYNNNCGYITNYIFMLYHLLYTLECNMVYNSILV